jgi:hypothetical protein
MTAQRPLNLTLNQRTVLVRVDTVMAVLGVDADTVYARTDGGRDDDQLVYVWNVAVNPAGEKRELVFWAQEVEARKNKRPLPVDDIDDVATFILGDRKHFPSGEVRQLLGGIRRPTLMALRRELCGKLGSATTFFPRQALKNFLTGPRWLGSEAGLATMRHTIKEVCV